MVPLRPTCADLAFRQRHHAGEAQLLVQGGSVLLVTRQPVERFRHDEVETPRASSSSF